MPILYQISTLRMIKNMLCSFDVVSLCSLLDTMGCKVCSLVWRNVTHFLVQTGTVSSALLLLQCFEHLHLPLCMQSPMWSKCLFLSGPIYSLPGLPAVAHYSLLASYARGSSPWEPAAQPSVVPVLLAGRTVLVGILCLCGWRRIMSTISPSQHCCTSSQSLLFHGPSWTPWVSAPRYPLAGSNHGPIRERGCPPGHWHVLFNAPLKFP